MGNGLGCERSDALTSTAQPTSSRPSTDSMEAAQNGSKASVTASPAKSIATVEAGEAVDKVGDLNPATSPPSACPVPHEPRHLSRRVSFQAGAGPDADGKEVHHVIKKHGVSMKKIVDSLYQKVLADERLAAFFEGIDMVRLKSQQEKLMVLVFGGQDLLKEVAPDLNLRDVHMRAIAKQGLNPQHWQWFVEHFEDTLEELPDIPEETKKQAMMFMATTRNMFKAFEPGELEAYNKKMEAQGKPPLVL